MAFGNELIKLVSCALLTCVGPAKGRAETIAGPMLLTIDPSSPGITIPSYFVGFSFELGTLHGYSPQLVDNPALMDILSVFGRNCTVRFGGNSSDTQLPHVAKFKAALAVGKKLCGSNYQIWGQAWQPIKPNTTQAQQGAVDAANIAQLLDAPGAPTIYNQIGNEPNFYAAKTVTFQAWRAGWMTIRDVILAENPGAKFAGPDVATSAGNPPDWLPLLARASEPSSLSLLTLHCYGPKQTGNLLADLKAAFEVDQCADDARSIPRNPEVSSLHAPLVVTEAGSFLGAGSEGRTLAAAIYNLRNMILFAENGWQAMNFHGTPATMAQGNPSYSPIGTEDGKRYFAQATLYAMLAFQQLAGGQIIPLRGARDGVALAVVKKSKVKVLVTNQNFLNVAPIKITATKPMSAVSFQVLSARSYADTNVTLGGAMVDASGSFNPQQETLPVTANGVEFTLCASCAALITIER